MLKRFEAYPLDSLAVAGGGAILWAGQGTMHARSGDLLGALQCFERALECNVDCLDAWSGLSEIFERMQDRRRAEACLEVCRRIRSATARERSA